MVNLFELIQKGTIHKGCPVSCRRGLVTWEKLGQWEKEVNNPATQAFGIIKQDISFNSYADQLLCTRTSYM